MEPPLVKQRVALQRRLHIWIPETADANAICYSNEANAGFLFNMAAGEVLFFIRVETCQTRSFFLSHLFLGDSQLIHLFVSFKAL